MLSEVSLTAVAFSTIPGVERVYLHRDGNSLHVLTVVEKDDDEFLYRDVYSREKDLMKQFPSFEFDFRIVARRGRPFEEIAGYSIPAWEATQS